MLSGRVGTTSALPSGTGGDDAWGLFGANDGGTAASPPDASRQTNADPRASAHPFFASARFAWGSSDDSPFDRTAVRRALLDTVPALASRCDGRGYARLCDALGAPELKADPRFATNLARTDHAGVIAEAIEARLATRPAAEVLALCEAGGIPCGPLQDTAQALDHRQVRARNMVIETAFPDGQPLMAAGNPVKLSAYADPTHRPKAPRLDEHRAAILKELGL